MMIDIIYLISMPNMENNEVSVDFEGNILAGEFPPNKLKLVAAWAEIHKDELNALWNLMQTSNEFFKIRGLDT